MPVFAPEAQKMNFDDEYPDELDASFDDPADYRIMPNDNVVIAGKIESEFAQLEVYIFEKDKGNLFVHHDLLLSSFPIALEWLGADFAAVEDNTAGRANYAIVGTMLPEIEIWDLDLMDPVEPKAVLSGQNGHQAAVTGLTLHPTRQNLLASCSADKTLKVWDLQSLESQFTYDQYKETVSGVLWHPTEESVLTSFSSDNVLKVFDVRDTKSLREVQLPFPIESFCYSKTNTNELYFGTNDGFLHCFDLSKMQIDKNRSVQLHSEAVTGVVSTINNIIITNSLDSSIKLTKDTDFSLIKEEKTKGENLFSSSLHPDNPYLFACGSSVGEVVIWDIENEIVN